MKSRPILFKASMVRAILEGRKTQTRRVVKPVKDRNFGVMMAPCEIAPEVNNGNFTNSIYKPNDELWVREKFAYADCEGEYYYWATAFQDGLENEDFEYIKWRPSIHMPRKASRIELRITDIGVERLQDISEEDAIEEGLKALSKDRILFKYGIPDDDGFPGTVDDGWSWQEWKTNPIDAYRKLWESINGAGLWDQNPWVWAISFERTL